MKDYCVLGDSERESTNEGLDGRAGDVGAAVWESVRLCLVCLAPLTAEAGLSPRRRPRRVHPGACAHQRELNLQRLRRRRARR